MIKPPVPVVSRDVNLKESVRQILDTINNFRWQRPALHQSTSSCWQKWLSDVLWNVRYRLVFVVLVGRGSFDRAISTKMVLEPKFAPGRATETWILISLDPSVRHTRTRALACQPYASTGTIKRNAQTLVECLIPRLRRQLHTAVNGKSPRASYCGLGCTFVRIGSHILQSLGCWCGHRLVWHPSLSLGSISNSASSSITSILHFRMPPFDILQHCSVPMTSSLSLHDIRHLLLLLALISHQVSRFPTCACTGRAALLAPVFISLTKRMTMPPTIGIRRTLFSSQTNHITYCSCCGSFIPKVA
ncbi:hypothetical protein V8B97DRAFT_995547 [Scleroderma yunnanense]